jgi:hypothetical protein
MTKSHFELTCVLLKSLFKIKILSVHATKGRGYVAVQPHSSLNLALDGVNGQLHASTPLIPGKRAPGSYRIRSWLDPRVCLDDFEKK